MFDPAKLSENMGRPRNIKRPVGLDVSLRRVLRMMKRPEDRMKCFREWRRVYLSTKFKREPTDQEVEDEIKLFRDPSFDGANCRFGFWDSLADFVPDFHRDNRRKRAQIAAAARWSKKIKKSS
jgi:hypothetical protein